VPAAFAVSPAYFSLTALLMPLFGDSDVVVRLVPAIFGVATVCLPWLWRTRLGTVGALIASLLLAVSPVASITSVKASGDSIAFFAILLLLIGWMRHHESGSVGWLMVAAAALGIGLASSPVFYSGLLTLAVAWLVQSLERPFAEEGISLDGRKLSRRQRLITILVGVLFFIAVAALFLWRPAGLGAAANQLTSWLGQFNLPGSVAQVIEPFLVLGRYELVVIILGSIAILWGSWLGEPLPVFLTAWFGAALLLMILQSSVAENVLIAILPTYLLTGYLFSRQFKQRPALMAAGLYVVLVLLGTITYFNAGRYLRVVTFNQGQLSFLFLALISLLFAVVLINYVRTWDKAAATQATLAALLTIFLIYNWGTGWWMTHQAANEPRERWVTVGTDDDTIRLADTLHELSWQIDGSASGLTLFSGIDSPVLRWYLRDFSNATFGHSVPPAVQQTAIITTDTDEPAFSSDYMGTDFVLSRTAAPGGGDSSIEQTLRWWLFHEHPSPAMPERVVLWVPADILP
jgi:predicted membrane-bound mannosyltransferase